MQIELLYIYKILFVNDLRLETERRLLVVGGRYLIKRSTRNIQHKS